MQNEFDITSQIHKLLNAGVLKDYPNSIEGVFSVKEHSHLLTPDEVTQLLHVVHTAMGPCKEECSDLHAIKVELIQ